MKKVLQAVARFVRNEDGPTAVEYAVMLALIIVLCIVVIRQVGTSASQTFSAAAESSGTRARPSTGATASPPARWQRHPQSHVDVGEEDQAGMGGNDSAGE